MSHSTEDVLRQLRAGEDSAWEFKQVEFTGARPVRPSRDDWADEIAAFAASRAVSSGTRTQTPADLLRGRQHPAWRLLHHDHGVEGDVPARGCVHGTASWSSPMASAHSSASAARPSRSSSYSFLVQPAGGSRSSIFGSAVAWVFVDPSFTLRSLDR